MSAQRTTQLLLIVLACATTNLLSATSPSVAVMDFSGRSVSKDEAAALADRFRSELSQQGAYEVMERAQMDLILKEQAFQQSGCVDQSCAVEAGQLIAVTKIVTGTVSRVGGIYSVNVKMTDVATGRIDQNISEDCDCPIENLLTTTMARIAARLAGRDVAASQGIAIQKGDASLFVKTSPEGARVYMDGRMIDGTTPLTVENLNAGRHLIRVTKGNMAAKTEVTLTTDKVKRLDLTLTKQQTVLKIMSNPSEAEIYLDRKRGLGKRPDQVTPALFGDFEKDTAFVSFFRVGYRDTTLMVVVEQNQENAVSVQLAEAPAQEIKAQRAFIKRRRQRGPGLALGIGGIAVAGGGLVTFLLAQKDYAAALDAKDRLERSVVQSGPEYDALVEKNKDKTNSGNAKSAVSYALWGVGAAGIGVGLVLFF